MDISIHALREEGDQSPSSAVRLTTYFYPRPPRGGRLAYTDAGFSVYYISIHALREEGDGLGGLCRCSLSISIHALREEGDGKNRDKISIFL